MDIAGITLGFIAVIGGLAIAPLSIILGIRHDRSGSGRWSTSSA